MLFASGADRPPLSRPKSVSSLLTASVAQALLRQGVGPLEFQRHTGVPPGWLQNGQGRVPAAQHYAAMGLLWRQPVQRDALQLDLTAALAPWPTLAVLLLNAPTLTEALDNFLRYRGLIGDPDELQLQREGDGLALELSLDGSATRSAACAYFPLAMLAQLVAVYLPGEHRLCGLELAGEPFMPLQPLRERHQGAVSFGHRRHRLLLQAPGADTRFNQHNPLLYRHFRQQAEDELQRLNARHRWADRLRVWLVEALRAEAPASVGADAERLLARAAAHWGTTPRTIQRRLQAEGTAFVTVLAQARTQEARRLLSASELSLTEIGERLGFSASSAFTRFFQRQHGMAPSAFRAAQRRDG